MDYFVMEYKPMPGDDVADALCECIVLARITGKKVGMTFNTVEFIITPESAISRELRKYKLHWENK